MDKFDLLKSHIAAYTRKDGAVVAAHDDKRITHAVGASVKLKDNTRWGGLNGYKGVVSGAGKHEGTVNVRGADGHDRAFHHSDLDADDAKKPKAIQGAIDMLAPNDPNWEHGEGKSSYPMRIGGNNHTNAMDALGDNGWSVTGGKHDEMKHPDGHTAVFKDGAMTLTH